MITKVNLEIIPAMPNDLNHSVKKYCIIASHIKESIKRKYNFTDDSFPLIRNIAEEIRKALEMILVMIDIKFRLCTFGGSRIYLEIGSKMCATPSNSKITPTILV